MTAPRRVAVITGTRAEFGLLDTVMRAIATHDALELCVVVAGAHLLAPAETVREVAAKYTIAATVPMQTPGMHTRADDARSLGRGVAGFADAFELLRPAWVVVLGDRIEAFAAASAASVAGIAVAHIHGGDRAEGVADEAMRHAISKLAHLHLAATAMSAERLVRMGEPAERVRIVGSPAIDDLHAIAPMSDDDWRALGEPEAIVLHHPIGRDDDAEAADMRAILEGVAGLRVAALAPNSDPGRVGVIRAISDARSRGGISAFAEHLPRESFIGALRRLAAAGGALVGNSSAGLIEAAAIPVATLDIGPRQHGREHAENIVHIDTPTANTVREVFERARSIKLTTLRHPYGDGRSGERIASTLATFDPREPGFIRKHNTY